MLLLTINVRLGVKTLAANLRSFGPILSNPVDLFTFRFVKNFRTKVSLVSEILNLVFVGILDVTNVLSVSKSDGIIGSLRLVAILTKYELNNSVNSDSFCTNLSFF